MLWILFTAAKRQIGLRNEMKRWGELYDLVLDGVILPRELKNMFAETQKALGTKDKLNI
jgi:hypothetical protein